MRGRQIRNRHHWTGIDRCRHLKAARPATPDGAVVGANPQRVRTLAALIAQLRQLSRRDDVVLVGTERHTVQREVPATATGVPYVIQGSRVTEWVAIGEQARPGIALTMRGREVRNRHHWT